jgi:(p)ppGpp synthase/HD superfamily hydrolase
LADIGLGRRLAPIIAKLLAYDESAEIPIDNTDSALLIKGTEGSLVSFGKCCRPIPGDHIIGHLSAERGIVIHRDNCSNVAEFEKAPDKWLEVQWENEVEGDFPVAIRLELQDQRWVFAKVAATISEMGANIDTIHTSKRETTTTIVDLIVNVRHRDHLALILRRLHGSPGVLRITRRQ